MPWDCTQCDASVESDSFECPECGTSKTSWTLVEGETRGFTIQRAKFLLLIGDSTETRSADDPGDTAQLIEATHVPVVPKSVAKGIAARGHTPAPAHVVHVRLHPGQRIDHTITIERVYDGQSSEELEMPQEAPESLKNDGYFDARFLFVHGPGSLDEVVFEGLEIVDLSEESETGYAPDVGFTALGRSAQELPTQVIPLLRIRLEIDPEAAASQDDAFTLYGANDQGELKYKQVKTVKDDAVSGDACVDLIYTDLDETLGYSLLIDLGREGLPYFLFRKISYAELPAWNPELLPSSEPEPAPAAAESFRFVVELRDVDPAAVESSDDTYTLTATGGGETLYECAMTAKDDMVPGDAMLTLTYEGVPSALEYSLEIDLGQEGGSYFLFQAVTQEDLQQGRFGDPGLEDTAVEVGDDDDDDAYTGYDEDEGELVEALDVEDDDAH